MTRNTIDSELRIIYIYKGVEFFTKKEAEDFRELAETIDDNNKKEKEMVRSWKLQNKEKNLLLMQKALENEQSYQKPPTMVNAGGYINT